MGQQVIDLREAEYQTIVTELEKMHTGQLETMRALMEQIRTMADSADVFSAELTSKQISSVLDTIFQDVIDLLEQVFEDSETGVTKMIERMMETDDACG